MRRVFWSGVGYAAGITSSIYVQRRVKRTVERYTPEHVRNDVAVKSRQAADRARGLVIDLREAAAEGVDAMRRHEQQLRAEFAPADPARADPVRADPVRFDPARPDPHRPRSARLHR